jgi:transcriptional regulator EpsA
MLDDASILQLHNILNESHELKSLDDFKTFIRTRIRHILPHEMAMCVLGEIYSMRILRLINIDFPPGYLQRVIRPDQVILSAPVKGWIHKRSPIRIVANDVDEKEDSAWHLAARAFGIKSFACHGIVDLSGAVFTYFEFGDVETDALPYKMILNLIVPHLHATLVRLLTEEYVSSTIRNYDIEQSAVPPADSPAQPPKPTFFDITERERQILRWIAAGKSNWEIGKILLISEFTVKNHVQNVLKKMSATSRTQAATKAVSCGLISEDRRSADLVEKSTEPFSNVWREIR